MAEFKIGDTVSLKSGGPLMTVDGVPSGESQYINCVWFDDVTVNNGMFHPCLSG
jgi:uncharacterized protein YodC (DUF2158 family)